MIYVLALLTTCLALFATYLIIDNKRKDERIQDLNERLIARNHSEYRQYNSDTSTVPELEYHKPISYWDVKQPKEQ